MSHSSEQSTISDNPTSLGLWWSESKTEMRSNSGIPSNFNRSTQLQDVGDYEDQGPALHSATSNAHDYLKCRGNRRLSVQNGAATDDGEEDDIWWAKLKQVMQSWSQAPEISWGDGKEWVGLELSLRSSDIGSAEGQQGIVEFLHEVVASGGDSRGQHRASETGLDNAWVSYTSNSNVGHAGGNVAGANRGDERRSTRNTAKTLAKRKCTESGPEPRREEEEEEGKDCDPIRVNGGIAVGAVLMFSSLLSKRDRAELHGQAQLADGITSGSYGVGEARFLVLTCGLEELKTEVDVELSHEKVNNTSAWVTPRIGELGLEQCNFSARLRLAQFGYRDTRTPRGHADRIIDPPHPLLLPYLVSFHKATLFTLLKQGWFISFL